MVGSIFFILFLEIKFSIQLSSRQFSFKVNPENIRGEILQKLCASHHASEANSADFSDKSCLRLRQKLFTGQISCLAFQLSFE